MRDRLRLAAIVTAALLALCAIPDARPAAAYAVAEEVSAAPLPRPPRSRPPAPRLKVSKRT